MTQPIQLGLRIVVDKGTAVGDTEAVTGGVARLGAQAESTGQQLAAAMAMAAPAVSNVAQSVAVLAETEAQATDRIRAMVAESQRQSAAMVESAASADQVAASIRRATEEAGNYATVIARQNAQMTHAPISQASAVSSDESLKYVAALQRQFDMVGLNAAEIAKYEAKLRGANAATQAHAYTLVSDAEALREVIDAEQRAGAAADSFLAKLKAQTEALGLNKTQLLEQRAAQLGVSDAAAPMIAKLKEAGQESKTSGGHMEGFSFKTAGAKRELLVLTHELSQGNFKQFGGSLLVLGEQTGAAGLLFSATGLAIGATVAAVGLLGYAMVKGALDQKHMNDALVMTGNYAGVTSDKLNELAHNAVAAGGSLGEAKKVATELANSGKFTGDQIGYITEATVAWEHATGKSVQATIKEFESLAVQTNGSSARATEAISKATLKLDDTYHFLTESVYEQIRGLEKEGDAKAASALATETFARITRERAEEIIANAGSIARAWHGVKEAISEVVDGLGEVGKRQTPAIDVKKYSGQLQRFDEGVAASNERLGRPADELSAGLAQTRLKIVMDLTRAVDALNKADADALAKGAQAKTQSEGAHAAARVLMDDQKLEKQNLSELDKAIRTYGEDLAKIQAANPNSPLLDQSAVDEHMAALRKAHTAKEKKTPGADDRKVELQGALAAIQDEVNAEKSKYQQLDSLAQLYFRNAVFTDNEFYAARLGNLDKSRQAELDGFDKQLTALRDFHGKTAVERRENLNKIDQAEAARSRAEQQYADKRQLLTTEEELRQKAVVTASDEAMNKSITDLDLETKKQQEANLGRETSRASIERETIARFDSAISYQKVFMAKQLVDGAKDDEIAQGKRVLQFLEDQRSAHERLSVELAKGDALKFDDKSWKSAEASTKSFAKSLAESFGSVGDSIGKMSTSLFDFQKAQRDIAAELARSKGTANGDKSKEYEAETAAGKKMASAQVKQYADISHAASGFFDKSSKGYKVLHATEQAFRTVELALALESSVKKIFFKEGEVAANLALNGTKLTGEAATTAASVGLAGTEASAWGVTAVVKALASLPFPLNLAAGAATLAAVIAVGASVMGSLGGGGADTTAKDRQAAAGTGSVLGDTNAKSDSIAKSLEMIESSSNIELNHTAGMLASLRNIESSVSGLGDLVVRGTGITSLADSVASTGGGFIGKLSNAIFGGKTSVNDTGIVIDANTVGGIAAGGVNSQSYIDTTKSGGWFSSDKHNTTLAALGDDVNSQFGKVIDSLAASVSSAAGLLGVGGDEFTARLNSFVVDIGKISLKDLSGDEIQKQLEAVFSKVGDDLAKDSVAGLTGFQKIGEGALETLTRIANDYAGVDAIFAGIGKTFSLVGLESVTARERLIDMAGGLDKLSEQTQSFGENFLTEKERLAPVKSYVAEQMAALGLADVTSRAAFKNVVLGLDESTEAGAKMFTSLMALQSAFSEVYPAIEAASMTVAEIAEKRADQETQVYELTHTAAENLTRQRQKEIEALDETLRAEQQYIYTLQDKADRAALEAEAYELSHTAAQNLAATRAQELAAMDASKRPLQELVYLLQDQAKAAAEVSTKVTDARSVLQKSYDAEAATIKTLITAKQNEAAATLKQMNALKLGNLSTLTPEQRLQEARGQFDQAKGDDKNSAATAYLEALQTYYGSTTGYAEGYAYVQSQLAIQAASASSAADVAKQQLSALNKQVAGQLKLNDSVVSVKTALDKLTTLLASQGKKANDTTTTTPPVDAIEGLYTSLLGRHSDVAGYKYWKSIMDGGESLSNIISQFLNSPEYVKVHGSHAGGLSNVPFNGYIAELHKDEAVLTAQENAIWKALNVAPANRQATGQDPINAIADAIKRQAASAEDQRILLGKVLDAINTGNADVLTGNALNIRQLGQSLSTLISKAVAA